MSTSCGGEPGRWQSVNEAYSMAGAVHSPSMTNRLAPVLSVARLPTG